MPDRAVPHHKRPQVLDDLLEPRPRPTWGRARWRRDAFRPSWSRPARRAPPWVQDTLAVTPVIGTVMILGISVIGIAAVLTWGLPNIQQTQASTEMQGMMEQFEAFDQITEQVMRGGAVGKASEAKLNMPSGSIQRTNGTLMTVALSPHQTLFDNDDRFFFTGLDDEDPDTFEIRSFSLTNIDAMHVEVSRYRLDSRGPVSYPALDNTTGIATIALEEDINQRPTRVSVFREDGGERLLIFDAWIFPLGTLLYERHTSFGNVEVRLENSAIIRKEDTGSFMSSHPLATVERDSLDHPRFYALFPMRFVDNSSFPGVEASGAGSYPILFGLAGNNLRANGVDVVSLQVNAFGDRGALWLDHFQERYDFETNAPLDPSVRLDAGSASGVVKPFNVVLMESTIEATMKLETAVLHEA